MARNRMIKPEFWSDEKLNRVSLESRLLFIALWNFADDYGFIFNSTRQIIGNVFPLDESILENKIKEWIKELIAENLLIPLKYSDKPLLFVKGWGKHQTVANKSKRSYVESSDLEQVIKDTLQTNETLIREYLESHAPKRKKKDESNKEKDIIILASEEILKLHPKVKLKLKALSEINNAIMREVENGSTLENAIKVIKEATEEYDKEFSEDNKFATRAWEWYKEGGYLSVVTKPEVPQEPNRPDGNAAVEEYMRTWEPPKND